MLRIPSAPDGGISGAHRGHRPGRRRNWLLVQPPSRRSQFLSNGLRLLYDHAVRLKLCIDVAGRSPRVIGESHRRTAEDVNVGDQAAPGQPIAEPTERLGDRPSIEEWVVRAHATCNSSTATNTPRRRDAAGARTMASARAARVLNGNQSRRSDRDSDHDGAAYSSRAARCSASAARNTSRRSLPVPGGSSVSSANLAGDGSQLYSSRNSAMDRHRSPSSASASKRPSLARVIGRHGRALAPMRLTVLQGTSITSISLRAQADLGRLNSGHGRPGRADARQRGLDRPPFSETAP
jgi:hypothetical protein